MRVEFHQETSEQFGDPGRQGKEVLGKPPRSLIQEIFTGKHKTPPTKAPQPPTPSGLDLPASGVATRDPHTPGNSALSCAKKWEAWLNTQNPARGKICANSFEHKGPGDPPPFEKDHKKKKRQSKPTAAPHSTKRETLGAIPPKKVKKKKCELLKNGVREKERNQISWVCNKHPRGVINAANGIQRTRPPPHIATAGRQGEITLT